MTTSEEAAAGVDAALAKLGSQSAARHTVPPRGSFRVVSDRLDSYTQKALQAECDSIVSAPNGDQNNTINKAAFNVGTLVGAGAVGEDEAREMLLSAALAGNHPEGRARPSISSGLRAGMLTPRHPWPPVSHTAASVDLRDIVGEPGIDWHDIEHGFAHPDDGVPANLDPEPEEDFGPKPVPGLIPEEFYAARPELAHIRQAGHSRSRSGDVALLAVLTRLSSLVSHRIRADTGIAGYASLNLFGGIVGPSGIGKSTGVEVADRLMPAPVELDYRDGLPIGSGEGMAEVFMGVVDEETGEVKKKGGTDTPVTISVRKQVRHNAFFYVDEGATLTRLMKERSGSTLGETLRSAAVGQTLGQTNASKDTSRYIPSGSYSMGLLVGFQPETAAPLFEEVAEGTPQRFVWVQVIDPAIPDVQPRWPGELTAWRAAALLAPAESTGEYVLVSFDESIKAELRAADLAKVRGLVDPAEMNPLDSQAPVMRVKLASLLAILAGRRHVTVEDWQLAQILWEASRATRDAILVYSQAQRRLEQEKRTTARIEEEVRVDHAKQLAEDTRTDKAVERLAMRLAVAARDAGPQTRKTVRTRTAGRDKRYVNDAFAYAVLREWVVEEDGGFVPGPVPLS